MGLTSLLLRGRGDFSRPETKGRLKPPLPFALKWGDEDNELS
jgi:hypothetical protein